MPRIHADSFAAQTGLGQQDDVTGNAAAALDCSRRSIGSPADVEDDFKALKRQALEQYTLSQRKRKVAVPGENQEAVVIDIDRLAGRTDSARFYRQAIVAAALDSSESDNERLVRKLRERLERVGIRLPTVEVRFQDLTADVDVYTGSRALPTIINAYRNVFEGLLNKFGLLRGVKRPFRILKGLNGILRPGRLTLLLGPPGSGRSTLLKALAGQLEHDKAIRVGGEVTYNGEQFDSFVPERTAAYISQIDTHLAELTVRETIDFAARCQGARIHERVVEELLRREQEMGVDPDPDLEAFLKALSLSGKRHSVATEYIIRILGLENAADTIVGNEVIRGVSGGQRKRLTLGEMIVGPRRVLFPDEISTGLDSATTFSIVRSMRNIVNVLQATTLMALLQPTPESFELFDDILLMAEGHIVFYGPREEVMPFFTQLGFELPPRKGVADFLQEVTSRKDQAQYWADKSRPYRYVPVETFVRAFQESPRGQGIKAELRTPYDPMQAPEDALVRTKYALPPAKVFRACLSRDFILVKRNSFLYAFRTCQTSFVAFVVATVFFRMRLKAKTLENANLYLGILFYSIVHLMFNGYSEMAITVQTLPVFFKHRDNLFFPAWAGSLPTALLRLPYSLLESACYSCIVYYVVGLSPWADR
ncbi:hypothetical protein WJX72_012062 [[Myrmecia] bisecta]|uniref:ABC transporter domain-containing protein n=1 Tax=[Myrmecia] bisecta TaxID=41462 RepID=A0AAW1RB93_9CHLO